MTTETKERLRELLRNVRKVAVLGASERNTRPAHYVPAYLHRNGYEVFPVNPRYTGAALFGRETAAKLSDLDQPIDVVVVFRRPEHIPEHLDDILSMDPLPSVVWFQLGIRNDAVAAKLEESGIEVVQDRCMLIEHRTLDWEASA